MDEGQIILTPGDVSALLGIKESTLRKYAILLKDAGYQFHVNEQGQRGYFERDVIVLKKFLEFKNGPDMTLEKSANAVTAWLEQSNVSVRVMNDKQENKRYDDDIREMKEMIKEQNLIIQRQEEFNKKLLERLDQQQKYIESRLDQRDELLMQSIRESQETKQLLLATKEEQEKKPRKGLFSWFKN